jgi:hypothetical protein
LHGDGRGSEGNGVRHRGFDQLRTQTTAAMCRRQVDALEIDVQAERLSCVWQSRHSSQPRHADDLVVGFRHQRNMRLSGAVVPLPEACLESVERLARHITFSCPLPPQRRELANISILGHTKDHPVIQSCAGPYLLTPAVRSE